MLKGKRKMGDIVKVLLPYSKATHSKHCYLIQNEVSQVVERVKSGVFGSITFWEFAEELYTSYMRLIYVILLFSTESSLL